MPAIAFFEILTISQLQQLTVSDRNNFKWSSLFLIILLVAKYRNIKKKYHKIGKNLLRVLNTI